MVIEKIPLHYKYSLKEQIIVDVEEQTFEELIETDTPQIVWLIIQDTRYPIYSEPSETIELTINRAAFPLEVGLTGAGSGANAIYQEFLKQTNGLQAAITREMDKFKVGEQNNALQLSAQKLAFAKEYLKDTPFHDLYLRTIGEDYVIRIRAVEYSARHFEGYDVDSERQAILDEAAQNGFFTLESLKAQRAGIRDFTHYYARTFGIYDDVVEEYQMNLAEYDIKRIAYAQLNEKRLQVLERITEPKAKAYAELFLLVERLGEIPFKQAEPTYYEYLEKNQMYPEYTEFATYFYNQIKSVSPGQPAVPFLLPDIEGELYSMEDFRGKFVLLDFWAGWCQPCLEEFPIMREIYNTYSRDELEIIGISNEIDSLVWVQDLNRFQNPWIQLYSGDGFDEKTFKAYKGGGIPFYILVDPDGNIARYNDMRPSFNFTQVFDSLLIEYQQ
ncbi:MAG: TlpA family protein disulfide reductase [Balneolales bacterium]|nr:TlpA family protein disulfide reductase [Balneolales bacterium]